MTCPRCQAGMQGEVLDGPYGRAVTIDICHRCQAFWFDTHESLQLSPGGTLRLFRLIGERAGPAIGAPQDAACPRCQARLRRTRDMQRSTRFEYFTCPNGHGRLTSFVEFLREKNFIRPLTPAQVEQLRRHVQTVSCSNCGGPVNVVSGATCAHCGSALSMLDWEQAGTLIEQLQHAEDRATRPASPDLPLRLARARRDTERAFAAIDRDEQYFRDAGSAGLIGAGLSVLSRWLSRQA